MSGRRTNLAFFGLLVVAFVSGLLMWAVGSGWGRWPTVVHGAAGVAIVAMAPWKATVSRRGLRRRGLAPAIPALVLAFLVVLVLVTGVVHRAGGRDMGLVLVLQVHVGAALVALPLGLWHLVSRPVRPRATDLGRRALLRGAVLVGGSAGMTVALPHAGRATTRSLERGSFEPSAMPITQWLFDGVPSVDAGEWRLRVGNREWTYGELANLVDADVEATLDCTGGWYAKQRWRGVPVDRLLALSEVSGGRSIEVRSVTGYRRRFPRHDAARLLLATQVGGEQLSRGHGFPARLVVPNRRGFWWVKWVSEMQVDDDPWWWQPPFPLD